MLVLTRKIGEHVTIGDDAVVVIQSVQGKKVRLAIEAPPQTKILRGELTPFDEVRFVEKTRQRKTRAVPSIAGAMHG